MQRPDDSPAKGCFRADELAAAVMLALLHISVSS